MSEDLGNGSVAELELLRAQRAQLANRLKPPWWYVVGSGIALAVACAMPIGSYYVTGAGLGLGLGVLGIVVLIVMQQALVRVSGVALGTGTWQYPSGRVWSVGLAAVIFANSLLESYLFKGGHPAGAIVVGVLAAVTGTICWHGHLRAIRRDLEAGRFAA
jgi:hypothetical protein